jgi:hypothetical protein
MSSTPMRQHVNDKCKECLYDEFAAGTWRKQVEECTSPKCPLYPIRPVRWPEKPKSKASGGKPG